MLGNKLRKLFGGAREDVPASQAAPTQDTAVLPVPEAGETSQGTDGTIPDNVVAAIAAAIASMWTGPAGFVVRRIRRVPKTRHIR